MYCVCRLIESNLAGAMLLPGFVGLFAGPVKLLIVATVFALVGWKSGWWKHPAARWVWTALANSIRFSERRRLVNWLSAHWRGVVLALLLTWVAVWTLTRSGVPTNDRVSVSTPGTHANAASRTELSAPAR